MEFRNLTPLDTLCFKTVDVDDNEFHVIAMKIAYTLKDGECIVDETDFPKLILEDEFKGEMNQSSTRFESDLAPAKPRCDVIINAKAYAPKIVEGEPLEEGVQLNEQGEVTEFLSGITIQDSEGKSLLEKFLVVKGLQSFSFSRKSKFQKDGELKGDIIPSSVAPISVLPLDYEYAFGGQNKLYSDNPFAENISDKEKLTEAQLAEHPEDNPPVAHTVYESNLVGTGYLDSWYLSATQFEEPVIAPQIFYPHSSFSAESIHSQLLGNRLSAEFKPAGFGAISRTAPERRNLAGTYDEEWLENRHPYLPKDFNFDYWNCAPADQQIEFPPNNLHIHLKNMTEEGDWKIELPEHRAFVLLRMNEGNMIPMLLSIDTITIEPELNQVLLTYRGLISAELSIRVLEARFEVEPKKALIRIKKGEK